MRSLEVIRFADTTLDLARGQIVRCDSTHGLTPTEVKLLRYLVAHRGRTVPKAELLVEVWDYPADSRSRAVANTVQRLRKKLEEDPGNPTLLISEYGRGIRLELPLPAAPPAPTSAAPAPPTAPLPSNLPPRRPGFQGRTDLLARLTAAWKDGVPLLTLWGAGGIGKTRLATEFGHLLSTLHPPAEGGVWLCSLASARSTADVVRGVADVLGVPGAGRTVAQLSDRVGQALAARGRTLLVLDNLEQVEDVGAAVVADWLRAAPAATLLATSRRPLGLDPEVLVELRPLTADDARAVLLAHARRVDATYVPDPDETRSLTRVATLVDHLPLALELAGPRLPLLGADGVAEALAARTRLLRRRGPDHRHASMDAAISWSWELLDEAARAALRQCAVFETAFELADAEAVVALPPSAAGAWLGDLLEELLAHSLLHPAPAPAERPAFRLFDTVRTWLLAEHPGDAALHQRHLAHALTTGRALVATRRQRTVSGARIARADAALEAARRHAVTAGDGDAALQVAVVQDALAADRVPAAVRRARLDAVLALSTGSPAHRAAALRARAEIHRLDGAPDAAAADLAVLRTTHPAPLPPALAPRVALTEGALHHQRGERARARACYDRALAGFSALDDGPGRGMVEINLGLLAELDEGLSAALPHYERAIAVLRPTGHRRLQAVALTNLAITLQYLGRFGAARTRAREALDLARAEGLSGREVRARVTLGNIALVTGDLATATAHYEEAATGADRSGDAATAAVARINAAAAAMARADLPAADRALSSVLARPGAAARPLALASRGILRRLQGLTAEAAADLEAGLADTVGGEPWTVVARAHLGAALADLDRTEEAGGTLDTAAARAGDAGLTEAATIADICRGHLHLARFRAGEDSALAAARACAAVGADDRTTEVDVALRLLQRALETALPD